MLRQRRANEFLAFVIGRRRTYRAPVAGKLCCYANDGAFFYYNNRGQLTLSVTRTA